MKKEQGPQKRHLLFTCFDPRIDDLAMELENEIRNQGDAVVILRPPGGVHLFTTQSECRVSFYKMLEHYRGIAGIKTFHLLPHTNCQFCGIEAQEKIGSGTQSDLRFHVRSARKLHQGVVQFFEDLSGGIPEIDVRILLTIDQRIVTVEEATELLPYIPKEHGHGHRCFGHKNQEQRFSV